MAYSPTYTQTDVTPAVFDFVAGIFVGLAGFGVLIGLGIALGYVGKHLPFVKIK